jgi:hypothetical protein
MVYEARGILHRQRALSVRLPSDLPCEACSCMGQTSQCGTLQFVSHITFARIKSVMLLWESEVGMGKNYAWTFLYDKLSVINYHTTRRNVPEHSQLHPQPVSREPFLSKNILPTDLVSKPPNGWEQASQQFFKYHQSTRRSNFKYEHHDNNLLPNTTYL